MALVKGKGIHTTAASFGAEGADAYIRMTRDGALFTADWFLAQALAGNCFALNSGKLTTPDTLNAGAAADGEPDLLINVPTGTVIIPTYIGIEYEDSGTALVLDTFAVVSNQYDNAVTATAETTNIMNMRTDKPKGSACSAYSVLTGGGATLETGNFVEFWRPFAGFGEDAFNGSTGWVNPAINGCKWSIRDAVVPPIVKGQGALAVFAGGQAQTGFITVMWVELPSAALL
jgi:hypothetical protein